MQYKVPQGIDMQDRILGPLTMVQFVFILLGGLVAYLMYLKVPPPYGFWLALLFLSFSLALSFEYIRRMLVASFLFLTKPRSRVWHKANSADIIIHNLPVKDKKTKPKTKSHAGTDIEVLAKILDTHGKINDKTDA